MSGPKLASLIDNFVQILRPGGQVHGQTTAFGILVAMGSVVRSFPSTLLRPVGARLRPTCMEALEEAIDWVCSWRAGGTSGIEDALGKALALEEALEVVLVADQCPARGVPFARSLTALASDSLRSDPIKLRRAKAINTVAFECDQAGCRFLQQVGTLKSK